MELINLLSSIGEVCNKIDCKLITLIGDIVIVIKIAAPVLLVVFGMIDMIKALVSSDDDAIKKGQKSLVNKIIAAALVFLSIILVEIVINFFADPNDKESLTSCVNNILQGQCPTGGE